MPNRDKLPDTKPYFVRAIHEWCSDHAFTPYIVAIADGYADVPKEFVHDGQITLNISHDATNRLLIGSDSIEFQARFSGVTRNLFIPMANVAAIYARENGVGMAFTLDDDSQEDAEDGATDAASDDAQASASDAESTEPRQADKSGGGRVISLPNLAKTSDTDPPKQPDPPPRGRPNLQRVK